jgi:SpoVK/Ycf46/Vps4 family AAA+-type ATPase
VVSLPYLQWAFGLLIGWVRPSITEWLYKIYCTGSFERFVFRREKVNSNYYRVNGNRLVAYSFFWYLHKNKPKYCRSYESFPLDLTVNRTNKVTGEPETLFFEELGFPSSVTKVADDIYVCFSSEPQGQGKGKGSRKRDSDEDYEESNSKESKDVYSLVVSSRHHSIEHIHTFLEKIKEEYHQDTSTSYLKIYDAVQEDNESTLMNSEFFTSFKTFDNLFFKDKPEMIQLLNEFKQGHNGPREKYRKKGFPNNLSFMLHGPPGTGKTSCIKAIANYLNRDLVMVSTGSFKTNGAFASIFKENTRDPRRRQKIYVFEEIDCCFQNSEDNPFLSRKDKEVSALCIKKEPETSITEEVLIELVKEKKGSKSKLNAEPNFNIKLNHEGVLNALDGPRERNGRVCIFTTNYIDRIDEAYLRYGRMDMVVHLDYLLKEDVQRYFQNFFEKPIPPKVYAKMNDHMFTQAALGEIFIKKGKDLEKVYESLATKKA